MAEQLGTARGLRMRKRLMLAFLGAFGLLAVVVGLVAWYLLHGFLIQQAEARAGTIASLADMWRSEAVLHKTEDLTGYGIRVLDAPTPLAPGTIQVTDQSGRRIEISYRNDAFRQAEFTLLLSTVLATLGGGLAFALLAWLVAGAVARPLETLATRVAAMGQGDLERPIPAVGSGEVLELATTLEATRRRLIDLDAQHRQAERLATLGTFTATIAHEVRNPLSAIRLTLQLLVRRHGEDPGFRLVLDELERVDLIVDELLAFSRGMSVDCRDCDLAAEAQAVCRLLARQAEHAGVTLAISGTALVRADPARIRQLLMNLVVNAIQAQHGSGAVRIAITADGFAVSDDGPGVATAMVPRLFDAFSTDRPEGTGLGLHIAKAIVDAHGARLVYHAADGGAVFTVAGLSSADIDRQEAGGAG